MQAQIKRATREPGFQITLNFGLYPEIIKPWAIVVAARAKPSKMAVKLAAGAAYAAKQGWQWRIFSYDGKGGASFISS